MTRWGEREYGCGSSIERALVPVALFAASAGPSRTLPGGALTRLAVALAVVVSLVAPADAQSVRLSAGGVLPAGGALGPGWDAQPGASGHILLPMYGGETRLALDLAAHRATRDDLPDFLALNATLGWGPVLALGPIRLAPGAEIGAGRFAFDDDGVFGDNASSESELVAGAYVRARVPVAGRLEVWAEGGARRTFFSTPATTTSASAGLSVRIGVPGWLMPIAE